MFQNEQKKINKLKDIVIFLLLYQNIHNSVIILKELCPSYLGPIADALFLKALSQPDIMYR